MMDCNPDDATRLLQRLIGATGGFLGGTSLMMIVTPNSFGDVFSRIIVSTLSAMMLCGFVTEKLGMNVDDSETLMGVSFCIGFLAWNILGAVALYFSRRENKDVGELIKEVKN